MRKTVASLSYRYRTNPDTNSAAPLFLLPTSAHTVPQIRSRIGRALPSSSSQIISVLCRPDGPRVVVTLDLGRRAHHGLWRPK
jgi:hypothetical protein